MEFITDPFSSEAVRTGAFAAAVVGVVCGVLGCYVVLRGIALVAEGLGHGILPGIAVAFALTVGAGGGEPSALAISAGALGAGLVTAGGTALVLQRGGVRNETAAAITFVFMLVLGVLVITGTGGDEEELEGFLFGDVLDVGLGEVAASAAIVLGVLAVVALLYRPFLILSFDRQRAAALGLPVGRLELAMLVLLAIAVVLGFRIVGTLLVLGLLVAPAATAGLWTKRLPAMMALAVAIAVVCAPIGLLIAWHLEIEPGASIVLVAVSAFLVTLVVRPQPR